MIDKNSKLGKLFYYLASIIFIVVFFATPFEVIIFIVVIIIILAVLKGTTKKNFLKLQAVLPTSKIRSLAMGMVEIQGKTSCSQLISAKIGNLQCIAYHYTVRRETRDSEGKSSFRLIEEEQKIAPFSIEDDTGSVEISIQDLDFVWLPEKGSYQSGNLHYQQTILMPADEVLLIGRATSTNNKLVIEKDQLNNVFNLTHASSVDKWNSYKPLLNSLYVFGALSCLGIIVIIKGDVSIDSGVVFYSFNNLFR